MQLEKCEKCGREINTITDDYFEAVNDNYYRCEECGNETLEESQYGWYDPNIEGEVDNYLDDALSDVEFWTFKERNK